MQITDYFPYSITAYGGTHFFFGLLKYKRQRDTVTLALYMIIYSHNLITNRNLELLSIFGTFIWKHMVCVTLTLEWTDSPAHVIVTTATTTTTCSS